MSAEERKLLGEPAEGLNQRIELAASQKFIETAQTKQDTLFNFAVKAHIVNDE
jgi:hypothetical protein